MRKKKKNGKIIGGYRGDISVTVTAGDATELLGDLSDGSVDLLVADPPYNIGRKGYDLYIDSLSDEDYLDWTSGWVSAALPKLGKGSSMWVAIYDNLVSEVDCRVKQAGLHKRGHIIWCFTFGVNQRKNFTRSKVHWLYYTKSENNYTFNDRDPDLRIPSLRQLKYNDRRADAKGRLPNDVWIHHPQPGTGDADVWVESRICGTFKERVAGMDNQMPESVLDRIIRATSNEGDTICDPFGGTFSTGVVAARLKRNFVGFDLSRDYCLAGYDRIRTEIRETDRDGRKARSETRRKK